MASSLRTPFKLKGWRRVLISGYPLWTDIASRFKGLAKFCLFSGIAGLSALSLSSCFLYYQYSSLPASTLLPWQRILKDISISPTSDVALPDFSGPLQIAASHGCPVALHWLRERPQKLQMIENWKAWRFPDREIFGKRPALEAVDVDIGEPLIHAKQEKIFVFDWERANAALNHWGVLRLQNLFTKQDLTEIKNKLSVPTVAESASQIGNIVIDLDPNIHHYRPEPNRLHLLLKGTEACEALDVVNQKVLPLVQSAMESRWGTNARLWIADARLVVIDNGAISEKSWKTAGFPCAGPGYTVILPLDGKPTFPKSSELEREVGFLRVLPGSQVLMRPHEKNDVLSKIGHYHHILKVTGGVKYLDDPLLMDNDLLIRAEENPAFAVRSYVKITYRLRDPEGMIVESSKGFKSEIGKVFEGLSWIYRKAR